MSRYSVPQPRYHFDTLEAYLEYAETSKKYREISSNLDFRGLPSLQSALTMARQGWPEGTAKLDHAVFPILEKVTSMIAVEQIQYDVTGLDFDMGMHLAGVPESWYSFENETREGIGFKHVKIVANFSVSAGISKEVIQTRGIAITGLVLALERAGIRVELVGVSPWAESDRDNPEVTISVTLKRADQPLDIDRLAFCLIHPAMLRWICFAILNSFPNWSPNMGRPASAPLDMRGDIYLDNAYLYESQWSNPKTAQTWILEQLKLQGVHISQEEGN